MLTLRYVYHVAYDRGNAAKITVGSSHAIVTLDYKVKDSASFDNLCSILRAKHSEGSEWPCESVVITSSTLLHREIVWR